MRLNWFAPTTLSSVWLIKINVVHFLHFNWCLEIKVFTYSACVSMLIINCDVNIF